MLQHLKRFLFSNKLTTLLLFIVIAAAGIATFIENDYGTPAAKKVIYNTHWFELVILLLALNLVGNIFKFKLYSKRKMPVFLFHVAWIVIIIGAGVTRYFGYEGMMHIREGSSSKTMISAETYTQFSLNDGKKQLVIDKPVLLNGLYNSEFDYEFDFEGNEVWIKYVDFVPNSRDSLFPDAGGEDIIELVTIGKNGRESVYLKSGDTRMFGPFPVAYNVAEPGEMAIKLMSNGEKVQVLSPYDIEYMKMSDQSSGVISRDTVADFSQRQLFSIGETKIVFKDRFQEAMLKKVSLPKEDQRGEDVLIVDFTVGDNRKRVNLPGGNGYVSPRENFRLGGLNFSASYGAKLVELPFSILLRDFQLENYPGSENPSSYASEVTLVDPEQSINEDHRIYMNHVLDHRGYRFFQSSYDQDQMGTVLSVNHDGLGSFITYIGYALLALGMILSLILPGTRFRSLRTKLRKLKNKRLQRYATLITLLLSLNAIAQEPVEIPESHADKFDRIVVQGADGRFMPMQTFSSQIARKITAAKMYRGLTPSQLVLSMMYDRPYWQAKKFIKLEHKQLAEELGAEKVQIGMSNMYFVAFADMFKDHGYVLKDKVDNAMRTPEAERSKYQKDILKLDERLNIAFMVFNDGGIFRMFPNPKTPDGAWYTNGDFESFGDTSQLFVRHIVPLYMSAIESAEQQQNWDVADSTLNFIAVFQENFGHHVMPSNQKIDMEMTYNRMKFYDRSMMVYLLLGIILLVLSLIEVFRHSKLLNILQWVIIALLGLTFLYHLTGLAMRWWISGHAPWSNAYEALTYIAWGTMLAGFIFVKSSRITMAATTLLAGMTLFVAWLNWLNPEITNLEPVLKSYWLTIHVAIITSSYAFLGLGAILSIVNLILMMVANGRERIKDVINELTYISEMTVTIGTFAAAIGTFLGGVWANESWGRYWGWDPKETWALIIVLTYSIVLHLRLVPGWKGKYLYNVTTLFAYSSVLMTFFGVNYYLSGLHSYAGGTPPEMPAFVVPTLILLVGISVIAYFRWNFKGEKS